MRSRILLLALAALPLSAQALDSQDLRPDAPRVYEVKKGDTLWDIAGKFLDDPWRWPELWDRNPFISNPDLIYPGDRLRLVMVDGEPRLTRQRVERLSPRVEEEPARRLEAISTVDPDLVRPFLLRYGLLSADTDPEAIGGHLVGGAEDQVLFATGSRVFFRMVSPDPERLSWFTYDEPEAITDPDTGTRLGYLIRHSGRARLEHPTEGGLYAARIRDSFSAIERGARIYPGQDIGDIHFVPRPGPDVSGKILRHVGDESLLGQGQVVVLSVGASDGLERGDVLRVEGYGRDVQDSVTGEDAHIPGQRKGNVLVIRTTDRLSFGLIMTSVKTIEEGDRVLQPEG